MKTSIISILMLFCVVCFIGNTTEAQDIKERIGQDEIIKSGSNYYNYAEKDKVNFEVSVWGYVKSPGKYLIPSGTTFIDLISLCGGPSYEAKLDEIRIVRQKNDTLNVKEDRIILLNYNDFLWEKRISNTKKNNPVLNPGDVLLIPGGQRFTFRENFALVLTAVSTLTSIAVLLVTIFRK